MRRALLWALLLCGCQEIDAFEPIDLVMGDEFNAEQERAADRAGKCWNLAFGTRMTATKAPSAGQRVPIELSAMACMDGNAGITVSVPERAVYMCPGIENPVHFFGILLHELGHVLNIWEHVDDPYAVMHMSPSGTVGRTFTSADRRAFEEANGPARTTCARVGLNPVTGACLCLEPIP